MDISEYQLHSVLDTWAPKNWGTYKLTHAELSELGQFIDDTIKTHPVLIIYVERSGQYLILVNMEVYAYIRDNNLPLGYIFSNEWCNVINEYGDHDYWSGIGERSIKLNAMCAIRNNEIIARSALTILKELPCLKIQSHTADTSMA